MNNIIEINRLTKYYNNTLALDNLNLIVNENEIYGLIGPDGAGKTTTIRSICGMIKNYSGDIKVFGNNIKSHSENIKNSIGYLSQKFSLYGDLSVDENINFFAQIHNADNYKALKVELLKKMNLLKFKDRLANNLSGGMKQKLSLICSVIYKPKLLLLDEPTTGVDPVSRREFWDSLYELKNIGITILVSTPYMDEAEKCDKLSLINNGKVLVTGNFSEIVKNFEFRLISIFSNELKKVKKILSDKFEVQLFGEKLDILSSNIDIDIKDIEKMLLYHKISYELKIDVPSLENIFLYLIKFSS
jgi:ABC-2 type transport system ATP-binding protein